MRFISLVLLLGSQVASAQFDKGPGPPLLLPPGAQSALARQGLKLLAAPRACPSVFEEIVWVRADGRRFPVATWSDAMVDMLRTYYMRLAAGDADLGVLLPDPAKQMGRFWGSDFSDTIYVLESQAFSIFTAYAAHALFVENTGLVPWSLCDFSRRERKELLDSSRMFEPVPSWLAAADLPACLLDPTRPPVDCILPGRDFQWLEHEVFEHALGDPRDAFRFMVGDHALSSSGDALLRDTPEATLQELNRWSYHDVLHGPLAAGVSVDYEDRPAVICRAFVRNTLIPRDLSSEGRGRPVVASSGCHSAAALMRQLARAVNLPLAYVHSYINRTEFHAGLLFRPGSLQARILPHTDILYAESTAYLPITDRLTPLPETDLAATLYRHMWIDKKALWEFGMTLSAESDPTPRIDAVTLTYRRYLLETTYQLCGDESELGISTAYCQLTEAAFRDKVSGSAYALRTADEYWARSRDCVTANGGCDKVDGLIARHESERGHTVSTASLCSTPGS